MARPADPHARASLVAAARKEFVRSGIQRARIEDITQACGLSKGAFYLHFESKEALFGELVAALQERIEAHRRAREAAHRQVTARHRRWSSDVLAELAIVDQEQDRELLELLWEWRDVTDVLLRGCQGTVFEGVMWEVLDREVSRVEDEVRELSRAHVMRADIPADVVGLMVVGTYLLIARRFSLLDEKPDFDRWVLSLHALLAQGTLPLAARPAPRRVAASRRRRAPAARKKTR
jgi:AcrR family transcriptional regulator